MKTPLKFAFINGPVISNGPSGQPWLQVRNADDLTKPVELMIYDLIGKNAWDDSGIADSEFAAVLNGIPKGRKIELRINSRGGSVKDGLGIYNRLMERRADVTAVIDGYAVSTASWLALAASKVIIPENGAMMIHNPAAGGFGTAEDLRKAAGVLDKHKDVIVAMYREKTGKTDKEISDAMDAETWFIGKEAKDWGLADEVKNTAAASNTLDLSSFRRVPAALSVTKKNPAPQPGANQPVNIMTREELIALLKAQGVTVDNSATIEQLKKLLETTLAAKNAANPTAAQPGADTDASALAGIKTDIANLKKQRDDERKAFVTQRVDNLIAESKILASERDISIEMAVSNDKLLDTWAKREPNKPGTDPVNVHVEVTGASVDNVLVGIAATNKPVEAMFKGHTVSNVDIKEAAIRRAVILNTHRAKLLPILNANTVDTALKRQVILNDIMRAFKRVMIQLNAFSTVFANVPLMGTDKINVPYYALHTTASTDFVQANGYVFNGNSATSMKEITIDARKYQPFDFSSAEFRRQPYFNVAQQAMLRAEQLGLDVVNDILSLITVANFGASVKAEPSAAFSLDDIIDIGVICDQADWPQAMRSLLLDSAYAGNVLKDLAKTLAQGGDQEMVRAGAIGKLGGFDTFKSPRIPSNAENLVGAAIHPAGILVATSPVQPAPGVLKNLVSYDVVTDPDIGLTFEYRYWGEAQKDKDFEVIECNYGKAAGEAAAVKRITSQ